MLAVNMENPQTVFKTTQTPLGVLVAKPRFLTTRRKGDSAPAEGPQETADESSLPGHCLEERVESFLDPSNEQELTDQFSYTSNPSSGFEDSESKHLALHGCESNLIVTGIGC